MERRDLERRLAELVRDVGWSSERLGHSFASRHGLHPTDFRALTAIYAADRAGAPLTLRQLAGELDLTPAAVTYAVDRLSTAGHVYRERGRTDRSQRGGSRPRHTGGLQPRQACGSDHLRVRRKGRRARLSYTLCRFPNTV